MKTIKVNLIALLIAAAAMSLAGPAQAAEKQQPQVPQSGSLTEQQKKEIEELETEILEKRKNVISKYVEYGVLAKEKGEHIKTHIEKHYEMKKQNGFVPKLHPHQIEKRH
ncbi:DUF2680 domain-containing protein [Bacillus atrophaeus]|uniref:DUF2680 domain-containing protein n=1 Tax=Bacillus atrophaeus TaxID=1452 RepID=UPI00227E843A|nr:DUF2680 domain-containing protein [Bacillus atrophaeus]MCY8491255.1 YckD family protein [Bacillus atrophaeus]